MNKGQQVWNPYVVGSLIGLLTWFSFATADHAIGITTAFEHSAAMVAQTVAPDVAQPYLQSHTSAEKQPRIGWEWMLVLGVFLGAFMSARISGHRASRDVPEPWASRFGREPARYYAGAFAGGVIMMFGARLAQGCTSGHAISGALQLAVSSWIFVAVFFPVAVITSLCLYGRYRGRYV